LHFAFCFWCSKPTTVVTYVSYASNFRPLHRLPDISPWCWFSWIFFQDLACSNYPQNTTDLTIDTQVTDNILPTFSFEEHRIFLCLCAIMLRSKLGLLRTLGNNVKILEVNNATKREFAPHILCYVYVF